MAVAKQVLSQLVSLLKQEDWFTEELAKELPSKWEKHGDLVLLPEKTFASPIWSQHPDILEAACQFLQCNRLARRVGPTQSDSFRSPKVVLLHGSSTWVTKKENGILYGWDLTKCMFSSGNITEKQRIAGWDLRGKTVVDMYAGIGYFTLTYLIHCKADLVYACEWNPAAAESLKNNLKLNKVSPERYIVLIGDNREMCPKNVADHVNLGLIPSSEAGWTTACAALKTDVGGVLHVHGNVDSEPAYKCDGSSESTCLELRSPSKEISYFFEQWAIYACKKIQDIFEQLYPQERWDISVETVVKVKSYAPSVDHIVADIKCRPQ